MKDGLARRAIKAIARVFFLVDLRVARLALRARGLSPFVLGGACGKCAACCDAPSIRVAWLTWYLPTLRRAFLGWHRRVNGFELTSSDFRTRVLTFRCTHFDTDTRRCDSYGSRPGMCRDYPRLLLFQPHPEMLPACGYRPIARDAKRFLRVLAAEPMSDAQREKLKRDLFLE